VLLFVLLWTPTALASPAAKLFEEGIGAARVGDYDLAAERFEGARAAGNESPVLLYNLAVAYFQSGRFAAAEATFRELSGYAEWAALAAYNQGLALRAMGREEAALERFQRAADLAVEPRLRALVDAALPAPAAAPEPERTPWFGVVSLAAGYDDNVALSGTLAAEDGGEGDVFLETLVAASRPLRPGTADARDELNVTALYRAHPELDSFDFGALAVSFDRRAAAGPWRWLGGVSGAVNSAGSDYFASVLSARLELQRPGLAPGWRAEQTLSVLAGGSAFDYLSGWRYRLQLDRVRDGTQSSLRFGYRLEINGRDDLALGEEFFSFSPLRHRFFVRLNWRAHPAWRLQGGLEWEINAYADDNRFFDGAGQLITEARDQRLLNGFLRLIRPLDDRWRVWSEVQINDSDSELRRYDYRSQRLLLGVERLF